MVYLLDPTINKQYYYKYLFNYANTHFLELMMLITITVLWENNNNEIIIIRKFLFAFIEAESGMMDLVFEA